MSRQHFFDNYGPNPAENYERFFVPAIGAPAAGALIRRAAMHGGEALLDVACGTGIVARLAAEQLGEEGRVAGLDLNAAMLAIARASTPPGISIEWHEGDAQAMPFPDDTFDVVLCQMGLQFMPDKSAALSEMRRVLRTGGRVLVSTPGPAGLVFALMADEMEHHISSEAAGFVRQVFSLHDLSEIEELMRSAELSDIRVEANEATFRLPPPREFLWQYVHSTPLAGLAGKADDDARAALEASLVAGWRLMESDGALSGTQRMVVATGRK